MKYFLLVYDKSAGRLCEERAFESAERARAVSERHELMLTYRLDPNIEIALLGADSHDDLLKTHSRYFKSLEELAHAS